MTPQELEAAGLTQDTKTLEQIVAPEKKADVFDPNTGKWGTYQTTGSGENAGPVFVPSAVQPTDGYAAMHRGVDTSQNGGTPDSYAWAAGEDPNVTALNKNKAAGFNPASMGLTQMMQGARAESDAGGNEGTPNGWVREDPTDSNKFETWDNQGNYLGSRVKQSGWVGFRNGITPIAAIAAMAYGVPMLGEAMGAAGVGGATLAAENAAALEAAYGSGALTAGEAVGGAGMGSSSLLQTIGNLPKTVGSAITPAGTPAWAVNAAGTGAMNAGSALVQGASPIDALKAGAKGAVTGAAMYGLDTLGNEVLSPILQGTGLSPKDAVALGKAVLTKDSAGLITAGVNMGIDGIAKFSGLDSSKLPSWLTKDNVAGATNLTSGLKTGNLSQVLSGASSLTGSQDVKTAAAATTLYNAAKLGNWTAIASAASALDKVLNGSGAPVVKAPDGADVIKSLVSGAVTDALGVSSTAKKPATPQNLAQAVQDGYMPPKVLAKIKSKFDISDPLALSEMTVEDLVKSVQSDEAAATESENSIYAAQGGSIDDLIEYLRR